MTDDFDPTQLDPDEREEIVAQIPVVSAAWRFIIPALRDDDLAAAWPAVDPRLRLCWAQAWLGLNRADAEAEGYDLGEVADALAEEAPTHPLWRHFSRVLLRDLHGVADLDPDAWGIGANARVLGVDIELLYLQDKTGLRATYGGPEWSASSCRSSCVFTTISGESSTTVQRPSRRPAGHPRCSIDPRWGECSPGYPLLATVSPRISGS